MVKPADSNRQPGRIRYLANVLLPKTLIYRSLILGHKWERAQMVADVVEVMGGRNGGKKGKQG